MRIEKLSENSIRVIMDKQELFQRNLSVDSIQYGSENTNRLFEEMLNIANEELGFMISGAAVIEAVPMRDGAIELNITRVESPDELDVRFSKFSPYKNNYNNFFPNLMQMLEGALDKIEEDYGIKTKQYNRSLKRLELKKESECIKIFEFSSLDRVIEASKMVNDEQIFSTLYKDEKNKNYYLVLNILSNNEKLLLEDLNKACNTLAEYGDKVIGFSSTVSYFNEHYKIIIPDKAISKLSTL